MLIEFVASALSTIIWGISDFLERLPIIFWLWIPSLFYFSNEVSHKLSLDYLAGIMELYLLQHLHLPSYIAIEVSLRRVVLDLYLLKDTFFGLILFSLAIKNYLALPNWRFCRLYQGKLVAILIGFGALAAYLTRSWELKNLFVLFRLKFQEFWSIRVFLWMFEGDILKTIYRVH